MKVISSLFAVIAALALAAVLFAAGFFVCAAPLATQVLSQATSNFEDSPYTLDDLNTLAVAARNLTVDERPAGSEPNGARSDFNAALMEAAAHSSEHYLGLSADRTDETAARKQELWNTLLSGMKAKAPASAFEAEKADETAAAMATAGDAYALDDDAFRHLDDCNGLINGLVPYVRYAGIGGIAFLLLLLVMRRWRAAGAALTAAPLAVLLAFAGMGAWAYLDFHSFFAAFHGVFFPQGNWTFSSESLLICMYPTAFWMGMGALWLATTALASIIMLAIGRSVARIGR